MKQNFTELFYKQTTMVNK